MIKEANVMVIVSDMDRAVQFYVDRLGLKLKARYGDEFAQVQCPGLTMALHPSSERLRPGKSESMSVGFGVEDLEEAMTGLKSKGIAFGQIVDDGPVKLVSFEDPDGNPLYLSQIMRWK